MPAPKKYPDELKERAVRLVFEMRERTGQKTGTVARDEMGDVRGMSLDSPAARRPRVESLRKLAAAQG